MPKPDTLDIIDGLDSLQRILKGAQGILSLPVSLDCDPRARAEGLR
jgi:hypothetical protein